MSQSASQTASHAGKETARQATSQPADGFKSRAAADSRTAVWSAARNILCVRLDNLGDVLMTTPALRALKAQHPQRRLTLLCSTRCMQAARQIPEVDHVIGYQAPWVSHADAARFNAADDRRIVSLLRNGDFDAAVIFTVYSQSALPAALMCRLGGIPAVLAHCRENPYGLLSDWLPETEPWPQARHEVQRQLDLVAHVGASTGDMRLSFRVPDAARARAENALREAGVDPPSPWLLIHPGATAPSRRYAGLRYAEAADRLARELGVPIVFNGSPDERALVEDIRAAMALPAISLAGSLDIVQSAALIQATQVLLANNSGAVHLAAAVGTPVVDLYALTNPQHTPWHVPHRLLFHDVPCRNCYKSLCPQGHHDCLQRVSPQRVVDAVIDLCRAFPRSRGLTPGRHAPTPAREAPPTVHTSGVAA